ncbi:MAG: YncE family protein [Gaiellales bacterium]|nr:MAG: YncE family protein [Gaiellales bacterium]
MRKIRKAGVWPVALVLMLVLSLMLFTSVGCGEEEKDDTTKDDKTTETTAKEGGMLYVASGQDDIAFSVIDLETKTITENVKVEGAASPHGIIADTADTSVAPDTSGRVATEEPKIIYLGNTKNNGTVVKYDLSTNTVVKVIEPPATAKMQICSMQMGPDGNIYLTSMGDGKAYPLNPEDDTIGEGIGGGDITKSICGIVWSRDGKYVYLSNMKNPDDENEAGYIAKLDAETYELVMKIEGVTEAQPGKVVAHQMEMTPDGKYIYVADSGTGSLVKIDVATDEVVDRIALGGGAKEVHSIVFAPDGKTAYLTVREVPDANSSSVFIYDVESDTVTGQIQGIPSSKICAVMLVQA